MTLCSVTPSSVKPDPPGDLTFRWHEEAVTVTCSELPHKSLLYEIQYKSTFDPEWQVSGAGGILKVIVLGSLMGS